MLFRNLIKTITLFDLVRNGILIFLCVLVVYSNFWEQKIGSSLFAHLLYIVSFAPFFIATLSLIELAEKLEHSGSNVIQKIEAVIFSLALFGLTIMLLWLHKSTDPVGALINALQHPNWILILVIVTISVHFGKQGYQEYWQQNFRPAGKSMLGTYGISIFVGIHFLNLYFLFGVDDGCHGVGSDPLFGGGAEYYECDEEYRKKVEVNNTIASQFNFNARALFAAEVLILLVFSSSALVCSYLAHFFYINGFDFKYWKLSNKSVLRLIGKAFWPVVLLTVVFLILVYLL